MSSFDGNAFARSVLNKIAEQASEYAGIPMPLESERLVIDPSYPFADVLREMTNTTTDAEEKDTSPLVRSTFHSKHKRSTIATYVDPETGKIKGALYPQFHHIVHDMRTMACSDAWGVEQEHNALMTLAELLPHTKFKRYLLTNIFMERSKRSGVVYVFRKLRPTVAIRSDESDPTSHVRILCTLCMHPIGYYAESWAGAMCPTDDVIAHLMLMRADEHAFWKRSNQTAPHFPEAGL